MADIAVTAASVLPGANAVTVPRIALAAITAGQSVYQSAANGVNVGLHDADNAAADVSALYGVALNGAALGQPVVVQIGGDITIGATVTVGAIYLGSDTAGGIRPVADKNTGDKVTILGYGKSATVITLDIRNPGIVSA